MSKNVIISKDMEYQLVYFDWDIDEVKNNVAAMFDEQVEVTDCEIEYLEVKTKTGKYYTILPDGSIEEGRM